MKMFILNENVFEYGEKSNLFSFLVYFDKSRNRRENLLNSPMKKYKQRKDKYSKAFLCSIGDEKKKQERADFQIETFVSQSNVLSVEYLAQIFSSHTN